MMEMREREMLLYKLLWAISSVGERFLHTEEAAGSKPASPTIKINNLPEIVTKDSLLHFFYTV
jgi:hypothetical protein